MLPKITYYSMDAIMCAMMNVQQWKLRHGTCTKEALETYLEECASLDRASYFSTSSMKHLKTANNTLHWESPIQSSFSENNQAQALFFPSSAGPNAPTLIILHALMSASDRGYRRIANKMNINGWNVLFPHLPFHYSRTPQGYSNGALAISSNLIRNGETLRQSVQEIRQLIAWSKAQGSKKISLLATSYGAWVASLLLSLEPVDSALLLQPITEIDYATFQSPISYIMGRLLKARGITQHHLQRHAHLTAPAEKMPLCDHRRIAIIGGRYDRITRPEHLKKFATLWNASYHEVPQGHFGYYAMRKALKIFEQFI